MTINDEDLRKTISPRYSVTAWADHNMFVTTEIVLFNVANLSKMQDCVSIVRPYFRGTIRCVTPTVNTVFVR